jgi:hypothetical protein
MSLGSKKPVMAADLQPALLPEVAAKREFSFAELPAL